MPPLPAFAACLGFVAVAFGAFGAHGLEARFSEDQEALWATATLYLLAHAVLATAVGLSGGRGLARTGGWSAAIGAAVFAGALYALALGAPSWVGAIAPLGGLGMLAGWGLIAVGAWRATR